MAYTTLFIALVGLFLSTFKDPDKSKKYYQKAHCVKQINSSLLGKINVVWGSWEKLFFDRSSHILNDQARFQKDFAVCMIGVGSLGSEISIHLAKAGIDHFILVDPDILEPENIARHSLDYPFLHEYKVDGVKQQILNRNPAAAVLSIPKSILEPSIVSSILESAKNQKKKLKRTLRRARKKKPEVVTKKAEGKEEKTQDTKKSEKK